MRLSRSTALTVAPLALAALALGGCGWASESAAPAASTASATPKATKSKKPAPTASKAAAPVASATALAGKASDKRTLTLQDSIGGAISPKSVVASRTGLVFAQNMMYRHSITVYNSDGTLKKTIPDAVQLSAFGVKGHPGTSKGAPVEAAFSPDGAHAYVSNYSMYGSGFGAEGSDTCTPSSARAAGVPDSYVYRISTSGLVIDDVYKVGMVPKYVAVTHDNKKLLVTDWCSYDLRVIDLASGKTVKKLPLGAFPRGIAVTPDSKTAYVAVMGSSHLAVIDLASNSLVRTIEVGSAPRHVVMDPAGKYAYVTLNGANKVVKVDLRKRAVVDSVNTGTQPRSMDIAPDGKSLYVVNYQSNNVAKVRASDMKVLQKITTGVHPIGITYDPTTNDVWVAVYTGSILVLRDR